MARVIQSNFRVRKNLGRVKQIIDLPNLIEIQKTSYRRFLQSEMVNFRREMSSPNHSGSVDMLPQSLSHRYSRRVASCSPAVHLAPGTLLFPTFQEM